MAVSVELVGDLFDNNGKILDENYARLETHRLPVSVRYFHPSGISSGVTLSYVEQSGRFGREFLGGGDLANDIVSDQDSFSVVDLSLEYRLGQRRGMVGLYLRNLFDEEFKFQDTDPENPRIMPERHVSLRLELAF
jgi:outer membrane receptor protein involved in Fe transport